MQPLAQAPEHVSAVRMWALRLEPGGDLKQELTHWVSAHALCAGFVASCVGSLARARLRMSSASGGAEVIGTLEGPMEILSLAGTLSPDGLHLHLALSLVDGRCVGGHLVEGCIVHTTAELVIGELTDLAFARSADARTGYRELAIGRS